MSCHGCARTFGFMTKEYGCEKCGFAYCSKCLDKKICKRCSVIKSTVAPNPPLVSQEKLEKLENPGQNPKIPIPPVVLEERLERLENPNKSPIIVYTDDSRMTNLKRGLSVEDQQLVNRLSKLKHDIREMKQDIPTQTEIEDRLAKLKGIDPQVYRKPPAIFVKPKTNDVDDATELIKQIREEVAIDRQSDVPPEIPVFQSDEYSNEKEVEILLQDEAKAIESSAKLALEGLKKDKDVQERLKKLRLGTDTNKEEVKSDNSSDEAEDSEDEANQAARVIARVLEEERLELEDEGISADDDKAAGEDELPWCDLCNEDAQVRCLGCDGDLYCRRCWKETHADLELKRHRVENYTAPK